ncbi:hypothetical protein ACOCEA_11160 [Maribacter sp. CXY002]|uniref:hypothetical protein n=1 Tax=Maribacter luteocoastalis TaxID=3407671 RepID=UPI003B677CF5
MKNIFSCLLMLLVLTTSCKTDKKEEKPKLEKEKTILEKIATANGYENWKEVSSLKFTFNVDRDSSHFERTWLWKPKSNDVVFMTHEDTVSYNRKTVDSTLAKTDANFVNDKYWFLAPYQLIWDNKSFTYEHDSISNAPMTDAKMQKLTIVYNNEGGYTPGDAYDFYFEDDYIIKEWVFRKSNQEEPNIITSWEDYKTLNGLHLSTMHKMKEGNFMLYFSGLEVK